MGKTLTAKEAAKLLGIHADTLRKRAKAGKVKHSLNVLGHLQFDEADILGLLPKATPLETKVIFIVDQSSSMGGLESRMQAALQAQVDELKKIGGTVEVGHILFDSYVGSLQTPIAIDRYTAPRITTQGMTALYAAIDAGLRWVKADMAASVNAAYLVMVITDGQDNRSHGKYPDALIKELVATDRVTLVANGPHGSRAIMEGLGFAPGNIKEWEATHAGLTTLSTANVMGTQSYVTTRSAGGQSLSSFYANVSPDVDQVVQQLNGQLDDVTKQIVTERVSKREHDIAIKKFAEKKFGAYEKGKLYYELTKSEKVQQYKGIIVQDKKAGKFYQGWDTARKLLGLPAFQNGEIRVRPGNLGEFAVYVQSTSVNRKLAGDTVVVKLP